MSITDGRWLLSPQVLPSFGNFQRRDHDYLSLESKNLVVSSLQSTTQNMRKKAIIYMSEKTLHLLPHKRIRLSLKETPFLSQKKDRAFSLPKAEK